MRCCRSEGHLKPVSSEALHHLCVFMHVPQPGDLEELTPSPGELPNALPREEAGLMSTAAFQERQKESAVRNSHRSPAVPCYLRKALQKVSGPSWPSWGLCGVE